MFIVGEHEVLGYFESVLLSIEDSDAHLRRGGDHDLDSHAADQRVLRHRVRRLATGVEHVHEEVSRVHLLERLHLVLAVKRYLTVLERGNELGVFLIRR